MTPDCLGSLMQKAGNDCDNCPERVKCWELFREKEKLKEETVKNKISPWYKSTDIPGICESCG